MSLNVAKSREKERRRERGNIQHELFNGRTERKNER
jgi:hypothetical protein